MYSILIWTIFLLHGYNVRSVIAQLNSRSVVHGDTLPSLMCTAAIDPSWLNPINQGHLNQEAFRINEEPPWASTLPEPTLRVAYLIPSNRTPQPEGVKALQMVIRTARDFFKDHLVYSEQGTISSVPVQKTVRYEMEGDGETPQIWVLDIPETDEEIRQDMWNNSINAAINAGVGVWRRGEIWLLVTETHLQQPDGSIIGWTALGAGFGSADDGGVALLGSTLLTLMAKGALTDDRSYDGLIVPEIGPHPLQQNVSFPSFEGSTLSSITSSHLGAFVHELTHPLGIGHDFRNDSNFHGNLMGNGFRGIRGYLHPNQYPNNYTRLAFGSAMILNTSHYFNTGKQRNQVDGFSFSVPISPQNGNLSINVTGSDADGLSLVRLIVPGNQSLPFSGAVGENRLFGRNIINRSIKTPYFEPGTTTNYLLQLWDKQGNKTEHNFQITPGPGNRAPRPFLNIRPPVGSVDDIFLLDASTSQDPDGDSPLTFAWDLLDEGAYNPGDATMNSRFDSGIGNLGNRLIGVRVTDPSGNQAFSTPMALHVSSGPTPPSDVTFTLIDASTEQPIPGFDPMFNGAQINLLSLPSQLSIRANVPTSFESVRFDFDGNNGFRVENVPPYALFGDIQGDYAPGPLALGPHTLSATPFTQNGAGGQPGSTGTITFSVVEVRDNITFTLIDASTNQPVPGFDPIADGTVLRLNLRFLPPLSIRANVPPQFESVHFDFNFGIFTRVENVVPYALGGDINGNYFPFPFSVGSDPSPEPQTLTATPFTENRARGMAGPSGTLIMIIVDNPGVGFTLIRAITNSDLQELNDGDLFFDDFLPEINVRVDFKTGPDVGAVESVRFDFDGQIGFRVENFPPYALFGDIMGDYIPGIFTIGTHTLSITAFTQNRARGEVVVTSSTIEFEVLPDGKPEANDDIPHYNYPNPFIGITTLAFELPEAGNVQITVYNLMGQKVTTLTDTWREVGPQVVTYDAGNSPAGVYYYQLKTLKGTFSGRMLLRK